MFDWIQAIDDAVIRAFDNIHTPVLDAFFEFFTTLGNSGMIWIALGAVLLASPKTRKMGYTVLLALLFGFLAANITLKPLIGRIRPYDALGYDILIEKPTDFSFPSGHTVSSFAGAVAALLWNKKIGIPALVVAVIISFSRIYFQVHYLSDVLGGAILGTLMAVLAYYIVKAVDQKYGIR